MTKPRKQLVCIEETPYYHVMSRCVRRAFLCGYDNKSGQSYEHRRVWVEERIHILSSIFAIDICSYAVMSNHYHIVLKLCPEQLNALDDSDICKRWFHLFKGSSLVHQYLSNKPLTLLQIDAAKATIALWRKRLADLSWFMKCLNETIARMANQEDNCKGHFWEARYKSQCIKTEYALLSCMAYVDLNPVRSNMTSVPENADHTSIKHRISPTIDLQKAIQEHIKNKQLNCFSQPIKQLMPFVGGCVSADIAGIPCSWREYLNLVDWAGRIVRDDKQGAIDNHLPPILERLNIKPNTWLEHTRKFEYYHPKVFNQEPSTLALDRS